ncbi:MAG: alpha/beta hydrolase [Saprospiraceae bacterium]|nr:alpha/beta hydrolase [Saprospiraceae bacterium]
MIDDIIPLFTKLTGISRGVPVEKLYSKYKTKQSAILELEAMPLHYRVTGNGPNLLLVHGVTSSLHTWSGWHKYLSNHFRVISFDVPSFGLTGPNPKKDYSLEMYMRIIDKLLDHLNVTKAYMAGNSFGGLLTWNYAIHNPDRIIKIALLNPAGINSKRENIKGLGFKVFLNPITKFFAHRFTPKLLLSFFLRKVYGDSSKVTAELVTTYHHMLLRKGNREAFSHVLAKTLLHGRDNCIRIKEVKLPTFIIWGNKDRIIPITHGALFEKLIIGSTLKVYNGVGHVPMEEIPKTSSEDVKNFFIGKQGN